MCNSLVYYYLILHFSDAIRIVLVHKYGGWYSDLDMVFLRPFTATKDREPLNNVVASDDLHYAQYDIPSQKYNFGKSVSNALFHNDAEHVFLKSAIRQFESSFKNGVWGSSGPKVFTKALEDICNSKTKPLNPKHYNRKYCSGMAVLRPRLFYPLDWFGAADLWTKHLDSYWESLFNQSYVVHFYESSTKNLGMKAKVLRPNMYGREKPAFAFLGPKECPISFFSERPF